MEQFDINAMADLLDQESRWVNEFRKETYERSFETYLDENNAVWESLRRLFLSDADIEAVSSEVAEVVSAKAQRLIEEQKNRARKENKQLNINMYMVSYFFPAVISCQSYAKEGNGTLMAKIICEKWHEVFPKYQIQYADYYTIQSGFKQRLCYITTAVCESLNKGRDCEELQLLKRYRDEYLAGTKEGKSLITEYYNIAPTIVKRMEREADRDEKYRYLWDHYIRDCISMVRAERFEECRNTYVQMMEELKTKYLITLRD